jgi:hypothetical protein
VWKDDQKNKRRAQLICMPRLPTPLVVGFYGRNELRPYNTVALRAYNADECAPTMPFS